MTAAEILIQAAFTNQEISMASYALLLLALSSTYLLQFSLTIAQTHLFKFCEGGNYTTNSTYEANLNLLLSSLPNSTIANSNTTRFFNNSLGRNPDRIYGLLQCRGDYNAEDCKKCANTATEEVTTRCPYKREFIVFYDECWLHYSNIKFISNLQLAPTVYLSNTQNVSNPTQFKPMLGQLMERLVVQAVSTSPNLFALGQDNFTSSQSLYGLVQCSQDLSRTDCDRCLNKSVAELPTCCDQKLGGRVLKPSCNVRYETYNFFETQAVTPSTAPSPPIPNTNTTTGQEKKSARKIVPIVVPTVIAALLLSVVAIIFCLRRKKKLEVAEDVDEISNAESLQLNFATVAAATGNFSHTNKLGEGGFGPVYKGKLSNGQEIAVKRLSRNSGQGEEEFKNEVLLLAKLQHRNLVRLLGFCLEAEEKLLIYEFVANASLNQFIFDPIKRNQLDWERRYHIIEGVARGLLYLHEDSQVRIIHRDLKASNILLDKEMNPKISDFGMARLCVMDQTHGSTRRVVGTYGYMSPEYAMHGHFSTKSDVFSFGVLVLEIISGKKNNSFFESERAEDLVTYAWRQWEEGTSLELLEPVLRDRYNKNEVMRCIHIGLLCVQEDVVKRPTMGAVALMLNSYTVSMTLPSAPALYGSFSYKKVDLLSKEPETNTTASSLSGLQDGSITPYSINEASITELHPR